MTANPPGEVLPPVSARTSAIYVGIGVGLCALATVLAVIPLNPDGGPLRLSTLRLLLVAVGALFAGGALSWRPDLFWMWLAASAAGWFASFGIPEPKPQDWDSARLLARVLAGLSLVGALLTSVKPSTRYALLSGFAMFHFGSILGAVTWPVTNGTPGPWITNQVMSRVYTPYYKFLYLSNAYHFYSPEPGPASHLFFLVTYRLDPDKLPENERKPLIDPQTGTQAVDPATGKPKWMETGSEWVDIPNRKLHYKDPLGLSYYRRLSVTEMVSPALPSRFTAGSFEKNDAVIRRRGVAVGLNKQIPLDPRAGAEDLQYRIPNEGIVRFLLPSYARHVADEFSRPGRQVVSIHIFRVEHTILSPDALHGRRLPYNVNKQWDQPADPYHPTLFKPFYLGEYDQFGILTNPTDPMLYWLCPILPKPVSPSDPLQRDYEDFMSNYVGFRYDWEQERRNR